MTATEEWLEAILRRSARWTQNPLHTGAGRALSAFLIVVTVLAATNTTWGNDFARQSTTSVADCAFVDHSPSVSKSVMQLAQDDSDCPEPPTCEPDEVTCDLRIDDDGCITWDCCPE